MAKKTAKSKTRRPKDVSHVWSKNPQTIRQFLDQRPDFEQLCTEIGYILDKRLTARGIEFSTVTWRAKTLNSFLEKIQRKTYRDPFLEITDFAGVRVVCLYISDIPLIEDTIRQEFDVVEKVDKLNDKGVDRFGYGAIHFIVKLGKNSSGARYDDLRNLPCEIQVRSVLQDAWAIIDHHLVYKDESSIPTPLQRKLNSLAGLFETADDQFDRVRAERSSYLAEVRESQKDPQEFLSNELNQDSFSEYLQWKFPNLPEETFEGETITVFGLINNRAYRTLADLDRAIEKAQVPLREVIQQLGEDSEWTRGAAPRVYVALNLVDESLRERGGRTTDIARVFEQHAIKTD